MISASPAYYGCPTCGNSEFWLLCDGRIMCADWPDCGATITDRWKPHGSDEGQMPNPSPIRGTAG